MTPEATQLVSRFFGSFHSGVSSLLLLDYDGTLAPFRVDRFQARPWAGVRELLQAIQQRCNTRIVVITGRPAAEIAPMLNLDRPIEVWGLHGAERLCPYGRREMEEISPEVQRRLDELRARLRKDSLGGVLEEKANGVVMHWRGVSPVQARLIEKRTRELFTPLSHLNGLAMLDFEAGVELRAGRDKGGAIKAILAESPCAGPVAFLGDDFTDEAGFEAVKGHGLSVLMRRQKRKTCADVWLQPPADLRAFLQRWLEASSRPHLPASVQ